MRQWQDASLASNAAMEREREQREELEIRTQELTRREEELRNETEDAMRQERERYRSGVETIRGQLEIEPAERRRVQQVASQAVAREQQLRQTDPADLIFDVLGTHVCVLLWFSFCIGAINCSAVLCCAAFSDEYSRCSLRIQT
jgi:hypothetical protein